jgi:heat-inducible transcriptional repressor
MELSDRQKEILYAIITEFIETAVPVGSSLISDKYDIEASPATIRYEMVKLADEGFISKEHTSSGRIPTILGYRLYIKDLMREEEVHYLTEIKIRKELTGVKYSRDRLVRGITSTLAEITKYACAMLTNEGIFYSGLYNLIDYPEFENKENFRNILVAFDDLNTLENVFHREYTDGRVKVIIGEELSEKVLQECSIVFSEVNLFSRERGVLAIVGPKRMNFSKVIPLVRITRDIIERLVHSWEG